MSLVVWYYTVYPGIILALLLSSSFRISTIIKTRGRNWTQRFEFLGCCTPTQPAYTPVTIVFTRSLTRPVVRYDETPNAIPKPIESPSAPRGESRYIIAARAVILTCIALGVPAYGIYTIFIQAFAVEVYTRTSMTEWLTDDALSGNATIYLVWMSFVLWKGLRN